MGWDGWRGNMHRLAAVPHPRRQGIARRLIHEAHEHLRRVGTRRVTALVAHEEEEATGLWSSAGYEHDAKFSRKTTIGQREIVQLYHRISMVFEDLAPTGEPLMR